MATINLRRVVGGLMARDAVVSRLLLNYADRLVRQRPGQTTPPGPCFLVPIWDTGQRPSDPASQLLAVEAHTRRDDPCPRDTLDILLALLHAALTDDYARSSITARFEGTAGNLVVSRLGTVYTVGTWEIAPPSPSDARTTQPRLLPWPDHSVNTGAFPPWEQPA